MPVVRGDGRRRWEADLLATCATVFVRMRQRCAPSTFATHAYVLLRSFGRSNMFATLHRKSLSLSLGLLLTGASAGTWAANATPAVDAGMAPANQTAHVTLFLKLHNEAALEDYIRETVTPGSAHYQQFL